MGTKVPWEKSMPSASQSWFCWKHLPERQRKTPNALAADTTSILILHLRTEAQRNISSSPRTQVAKTWRRGRESLLLRPPVCVLYIPDPAHRHLGMSGEKSDRTVQSHSGFCCLMFSYDLKQKYSVTLKGIGTGEASTFCYLPNPYKLARDSQNRWHRYQCKLSSVHC